MIIMLNNQNINRLLLMILVLCSFEIHSMNRVLAKFNKREYMEQLNKPDEVALKRASQAQQDLFGTQIKIGRCVYDDFQDYGAQGPECLSGIGGCPSFGSIKEYVRKRNRVVLGMKSEAGDQQSKNKLNQLREKDNELREQRDCLYRFIRERDRKAAESEVADIKKELPSSLVHLVADYIPNDRQGFQEKGCFRTFCQEEEPEKKSCFRRLFLRY